MKIDGQSRVLMSRQVNTVKTAKLWRNVRLVDECCENEDPEIRNRLFSVCGAFIEGSKLARENAQTDLPCFNQQISQQISNNQEQVFK